MPAYQILDTEDPRPQLHAFVDYFVATMEEIILRQPTSINALPLALLNEPLLPENLQGLFAEAWFRCREREVDALHKAIETVSNERLIDHGLVGPELRAKLSGVATVSAGLFASPVRRVLAKLLSIIDTVLESIGSATIAGAGLIELKKVIENLID